MATIEYTPFSHVYETFLSKITDDMYMELTPEDTYKLLRQLLVSAVPRFEFPKQSLDYDLFYLPLGNEEQNNSENSDDTENLNIGDDIIIDVEIEDGEENYKVDEGFINILTQEEINIIAIYMVVEWLNQQLASVENTRMKYSGSDFKFTSQANHMQKLLQLKKDYEREGFHLQRLYKRRAKDASGVYRSTLGKIMSTSASSGYTSLEDVKSKSRNINYNSADENLVFDVRYL